MKKIFPAILLTLSASLASCGSKEVIIDYDNPQYLNKSEFEQALSLFFTGNCTLEMDEAYNRETKAECNKTYIFTAEIDFDANIFHGVTIPNPEDGSTQTTSSLLEHGDFYLYAGKNRFVQKEIMNHGADEPKIEEYAWENKGDLSFADLLESRAPTFFWPGLYFQTDFYSYGFDFRTATYNLIPDNWGFYGFAGCTYSIRALQFASGRLSRVYSRELNGWNKVTKVGTTKVTIPDDVKEKGDNGPVTTVPTGSYNRF